MSIKIMTRVWDSGIKDLADKMILLKMADYADDRGGNIYPSVPTLASKCCLTDRAVRTHIGKMIKAGWISVQGVVRVPRGHVKCYAINVRNLPPPAPEHDLPLNVVQVTPERGSGLPLNVVQVTPERGSGLPLNVVQVTPERGSGNPSIEPSKGTVKDPQQDEIAPSDAPGDIAADRKSRAERNADPSFTDERVAAHIEVMCAPLDQFQRQFIVQQVDAGDPAWRDALVAWRATGWNVTNLPGQVDYYRRRKAAPPRPASGAGAPAGANGKLAADDWRAAFRMAGMEVADGQ